jgi:putative ABC transport system substrate-binding protein
MAIVAFAMSLAALAADARAQDRLPIIARLHGGADSGRVTAEAREGFTRGMRELGYEHGKNVIIEWHFGEGDVDRLRRLAADLVRRHVDIVVVGGTVPSHVMSEATHEIPIVMSVSGDPVGAGLVQNLARPGGNVTGLSGMFGELYEKQLELIKEIAPYITTAIILVARGNPLFSEERGRQVENGARSLGVRTRAVYVSDRRDIEQAFDELQGASAHAILAVSDPVVLDLHRKVIAARAMKDGIPLVASFSAYAHDGALMSYGVDLKEMHRRSALYVDRILKGAKPGDLPIEQPSKLELSVNLTTAHAIGLRLSPAFLARADEVIE